MITRFSHLLMEPQDKYPGLESEQVGHPAVGTPLTTILEQLECFGTEVMPPFTSRVGGPAVVDS